MAVMSPTAEGAAPAAASNPEWLKLGTNKFPTHATELQDLIRAAVAREIPESNISAFSFNCELAGPDLPQVAIDMSGWQVPIPGMGEYVSPFDKPEAPQTVNLVPGMAQQVDLRAEPLEFGGCPITINAAFQNLPLAWHTLDSAELALGFAEDPVADAPPRTGKFSIEFPAQRLGEAFLDAFNQLPDYSKVEFYRPLVRCAQPAADAFEITASCRVRYKIFRVRLGIVISGRLNPNGILTIDRISLRGSNLIVRMFTGIMRRELEKTYDLNEGLPAGSRLSNLHFVAGENIKVSGDIA